MALVVGAALVAAGPTHAAPTLNYGCSPPAEPTPSACDGWHTGPVTLIWDWDALQAQPVGGDCTPQTIREDVAALAASCEIQDLLDMSTTQQTVFLHVDTTPPVVTSVAPDRPPDSGGWWNHPVGFTFSGTDSTSGIASCAPVALSSPLGRVVGTCTDAAGNVGTASFPVSYDDTPPALSAVSARAGNRSATVSWQASSDVVTAHVVRTPGLRGTSGDAVFDGTGNRFRDRFLSNGVVYRYKVTVVDQAGNSTSKMVATRPLLAKGLVPADGALVGGAPLLRWPALKHARYYNVQLFKGKRKLLSTWPSRPRLALPNRWTFDGHRVTLGPGKYRWYVWPGYGPRTAHRYGRLIGRAVFAVAG